MNLKNSTLRHFGINTLIQIQLRVLNENTHNHENEFQKQLLSPYLKLFRSKYSDTRERVIRAVSELLENAGDKISSGWPSIVELLKYVPSTENKVNNNNNSNNAVSVTCLKLAFDDVRLISSDFCLLGLIKTVGLDNNISYSSIGLLWKISDHITLITKEDKEDKKKENNLRSIVDGLQIAIFNGYSVSSGYCAIHRFHHCCSQTPQYWSSLIDCYECMIRNIGHKQSELHESESDASSVCDAMMDSVKDLLNPVSAARAHCLNHRKSLD